MKRYILIFYTALLALSLSGQKQEVIASAGGYNAAGGISISWTLGETIIPTFKAADNSLILTHGFQQQLIVTTIEENLFELVNVTVYPNPASEILNIRFEVPLDGEVDLYLLSQQGSLVRVDIIEAATVEKQINMQDLPAGVYFLRLIKGKLSNVYKVVKLLGSFYCPKAIFPFFSWLPRAKSRGFFCHALSGLTIGGGGISPGFTGGYSNYATVWLINMAKSILLK